MYSTHTTERQDMDPNIQWVRVGVSHPAVLDLRGLHGLRFRDVPTASLSAPHLELTLAALVMLRGLPSGPKFIWLKYMGDPDSFELWLAHTENRRDARLWRPTQDADLAMEILKMFNRDASVDTHSLVNSLRSLVQDEIGEIVSVPFLAPEPVP